MGGVNGVGKSGFTGVLKERTTDLGVIIDVDKITAELDRNPLPGYKTEATAKEVKELGYHIRMFYAGLDTLFESLVRIENRVKRGGHNIPKETE